MVSKHTQSIADQINLMDTEAHLLLRLINDPDDDEARAMLHHLQSLKDLLCEKERLESRRNHIEDERI